MKKLKFLSLVILCILFIIAIVYSFQNILFEKYDALGSGSSSERSEIKLDAVYLDVTGGINYAERSHKILQVIPFGTEQYYAVLDLRNEEKPVLLTAIVKDSDIIKKLEDTELVRLKGTSKQLRYDAQKFFNETVEVIKKEAPEWKDLIVSNQVIDTTDTRTKVIVYLIVSLSALLYCIWLLAKSFKRKEEIVNKDKQ